MSWRMYRFRGCFKEPMNNLRSISQNIPVLAIFTRENSRLDGSAINGMYAYVRTAKKEAKYEKV